MSDLARLLDQNRAWAVRRRAAEPQFFERLSDIQKPEYLWIGCSDSRVPANEIVGLAPGELFVHRNVANIVAPGDTNCMAVVQYAVETLGVRHIIVCGHYGCGGVRAALEGDVPATAAHVERWLAPLRHLALDRSAELTAIENFLERWRRLCEMNVAEQVRRLLASDVLINTSLRGLRVDVHGWIYDLRDGLLRDLNVTRSAANQIVGSAV
jgi:carbonic anhydrase